MTLKSLQSYSDYLHGCRFCPMCKPASDVANVTLLESHSTRARAMMLWRYIKGMSELTPRDGEILYQSTLDSISQVWCFHHYPVSEYILAARHEALRKNVVPEAVKTMLSKKRLSTNEPDNKVRADTVFLLSEMAELDEIPSSLTTLLKDVLPDKAVQLILPAGCLYFSLGDFDAAKEQAERVVQILGRLKVKQIIADGPYTIWALRAVFPALGIEVPNEIQILSINDVIEELLHNGKLSKPTGRKKVRVFFHDARCATFFADELAEHKSILPEFDGPEEALGKGKVFEKPRALIKSLGHETVHSVWSRSLAKSCGIEGGLWKIYPETAGELAKRCIDEAARLGADVLATDSLLCAAHLKNAGKSCDLAIKWLPELLIV